MKNITILVFIISFLILLSSIYYNNSSINQININENDKINDQKQDSKNQFSISIFPRDKFNKVLLKKLRAIFENRELPKDQLFLSSKGLNNSIYVGEHSFLQTITSSPKNIIIGPDNIWSLIIQQLSSYLTFKTNDKIFQFYNNNITKSSSNEKILFNLNDKEIDVLNKLKNYIGNDEILSIIEPTFSTTKTSDDIAILTQFIGDINRFRVVYFHYYYLFETNIPYITLLGEVKDYEIMKIKLNQFYKFKSNTIKNDKFFYEWVNLINQIIDKFIITLKKQQNSEILDDDDEDWWLKIFNKNKECNEFEEYLNGWLTLFFQFTSDLSGIENDRFLGENIQKGYSYFDVQTIDSNGIITNSTIHGGHISVDVLNKNDKTIINPNENNFIIFNKTNQLFKPRLDWAIVINK